MANGVRTSSLSILLLYHAMAMLSTDVNGQADTTTVRQRPLLIQDATLRNRDELSRSQAENLQVSPTLRADLARLQAAQGKHNTLSTADNSCGGIIMDSGLIRSPGYPEFYPHHANCTWELYVSNSAEYVQLEFHAFSTEERWDIVAITSQAGVVRRFSGMSLPPKALLGRRATVSFTSNGAVSNSGFQFMFTTTSCPHGWIAREASCYYLITTARKWENARKTCIALGGALLEIEDEKEDFFAFEFSASRGASSAWIGMNDKIQEGSFVWDSGQQTSYRNWLQEPDNYYNEDCVHTLCFQGNCGWNDAKCDELKPAICELQIGWSK